MVWSHGRRIYRMLDAAVQETTDNEDVAAATTGQAEEVSKPGIWWKFQLSQPKTVLYMLK